ncbi:ferrous iron transporter B [Sphingopyxis sp. SCN 67-31]|uniref:ferrous iron transporter B n=1 Tax=Sphingopyxis sp. SCN 67-31 TaxID=1660142 RepID=UPI00086899F2|nr:ferrous iron transporter B [Sphingopyxis sp. SCN 67-31]ODU23903.1 MAG: ferrous iron transporter B [Sphingopyxis sp. SCN 67-31]
MTGPAPTIALVGNPNAGKSSLFNALTGARQKIANYPGVTVERKSGHASFADGRPLALVDLPGSYSLSPASPDEAVTRDVVLGRQTGEKRPDALIVVVDAANLDNHLCFALELIALGLPTVVALNMLDLAERDGLTLDPDRLAAELGVPVVPTVAVRKRGLTELLAAVDGAILSHGLSATDQPAPPPGDTALHQRARAIARAATLAETPVRRWTQRVDAVALHPVFGLLILLALMFVMFQAVYAWSEAPIAWIEDGIAALQALASDHMAAGFLRGLVVEGLLAGVGAVVVFLPQILILFLFILLLEASGYMTRAAFLMDGIMAKVGLSGRGFIPLLSSFACAVPGIMATRAIPDAKDRLTTILIAPLMTCSARLPVYTLIIGAFIPNRSVGGSPVGLQGLVLFGLYVSGIVGALVVAFALRRSVTKGNAAGFMMEMPRYQWPRLRDVGIALWQRAWIFLRRAGTIIAATTAVLWLLLSYPQAPAGSDVRQVDYSIAGRIASGLEVMVKPIGFNHDIALALIPAMAAREVAVSALATANAIDAGDDEDAVAQSLSERLQGRWSIATALAFLAWFVFAPQCISTIAITRRETNGWKWPLFMVGYLFALAYAAAGITYWTAVAFGLG